MTVAMTNGMDVGSVTLFFPWNPIPGTPSADTLKGGGGSDWLTGGGGDDTLKGGGGADILDGGDGIDTASYAYSSGGVGVSLRTGRGFGGDAEGDLLGNIENLVGSSFDDGLEGNDAANVLLGQDGNDRLRGNGGADYLDGGNGIDTALYVDSNAGVTVSLALGRGFDGTADGDTLVNIENLVGSAFDDQLVGDDGANVLEGREGNDFLIGGLGADHLSGSIFGSDVDTASYGDSSVGVRVNLTTGQGSGGTAEGDTLEFIENLLGSNFNDVLIGSNVSNELIGQDGNDVLVGGADADILNGGAGIDTVDYSSSPEYVQVYLRYNLGVNGDASGDTFYGIENVTGSQFGDYLVGDGGSNIINGGGGGDQLLGGGGNDTLIGGAGNDSLEGILRADDVSDSVCTMFGGTGDDHYFVDRSTSVAIEARNEGFDRVEALASYSLPAGSEIEELRASQGTTPIDLGGNEFDNTIVGNDGRNNIAGGLGRDTLIGGLGQDFLTGGAGGDMFTWNNVAETRPAGDQADVVTDFNRVEGDLLAVKQIDANTLVAGDQDFTFVGFVDFTPGHQFTGAGQIGFFTTPTDTFILLNTVVNPGPGGIDFEEATIRLAGVHTPDASWFVL